MSLLYTHSGKLGDLIYSLNFAKEYATQQGCDTFDLYLQTWCRDPDAVRLTEQSVGWIKPLLEYQPYINKVTYGRDKPIDAVDLDRFRRNGVQTSASDIRLWYYRDQCNVLPKDLTSPMLTAPSISGLENKIIIGRSSRYHRRGINYNGLKDIRDSMLFVGTPSEYTDFCKCCFKVAYYPTEDALVLASVLKSASVVIANQSCIFALAEQLKVPRILEPAEYTAGGPNVLPIGGRCYTLLRSPSISDIKLVSGR